MADYFPFDSGPGSNVTEAQWGLMAKNWLGTGVIKGAINEFQVYADSSGMQVKVKSGQAWIEGFFFQVVTESVIPISIANSSNPRIDRIAIQVDWTNNIISLIAIQGTPAASPTPPALTQGSAIWQISLAQVYVGANVSTIAAGNVTDERNFVKNANAIQGKYTNLVLQNGWAAVGGYATPGYLLDEMGFVHLRGSAALGTTTSGTVIATLPAGCRPINTIFVQITTYFSSSSINSALQINPDGTITCYGNVGNTNLSFDMFPVFKAEQ